MGLNVLDSKGLSKKEFVLMDNKSFEGKSEGDRKLKRPSFLKDGLN